jgi:MOSC domain-containing protein YiiM
VGHLLSLNAGRPRPVGLRHELTGIDKRPVDGPRQVFAPGPKGTGGSGLEGDTIVDTRHHGGDD